MAAAAADGAPILLVGTRKADVVRMESAPRHAYLHAEHLTTAVAAALWRAALQPVWQRQGLADITCHVIGFHVTQGMRVRSALADVTSIICLSLGGG